MYIDQHVYLLQVMVYLLGKQYFFEFSKKKKKVEHVWCV